MDFLYNEREQSPCQAHARGAGVSDVLHEALYPYESLRLDGAPVEGIHRDIQQLLDRASAARFPYVAARLRLSQNAEDFHKAKQAGAAAEARFLSFFEAPSRLHARRWVTSKVPKSRHLQRKEVVARAYRIWPYNSTDDGWLATAVEDTKVKVFKKTLSEADFVRLDFYKAALLEKTLFSLPDDEDPVLNADNGQAGCGWKYFQVISVGFARKKVQHDMYADDSRFPVYVQRFHRENAEHFDQPVLRRVGLPFLVDACELVPWRYATTRLRLWRVAEILPGTLSETWSDAVLATESFTDMMSESTPVYTLAKMCRAAGFRVGTVRELQRDSPRILHRVGMMRKKNYFRVLLKLDALFEAGVVRVVTHQSEAYYRALLHSPSPADVLPGLPAATYKQMLHGVVDLPERPAGGWNDVQDDEWQEHPASEEEPDFAEDPVAHDVDAQGHNNADEASDSSSSSTKSANEEPAPETLASLNFPEMILGCRLSLDVNIKQGYRRLCVECPWSRTVHKHRLVCKKYRRLPREGQAPPLEPLAYLGAWVQAAERFAERANHVAHNPPAAAVRAFARTNNIALEM